MHCWLNNRVGGPQLRLRSVRPPCPRSQQSTCCSQNMKCYYNMLFGTQPNCVLFCNSHAVTVELWFINRSHFLSCISNMIYILSLLKLCITFEDIWIRNETAKYAELYHLQGKYKSVETNQYWANLNQTSVI